MFDDLFRNKNSKNKPETEAENPYKKSAQKFIQEIRQSLEETDPLQSQSTSISPQDLMRNYENIKILSINPQNKNQLEKLVKEAKDDLQRLKRIVNTHH